MASNATGHHADGTRPKKVAIDEKLWAECRALKARADGPPPALVGTVDGCKVYVVDANKIMVSHDADFTQGGNALEDPKLCGRNEIVLDDRVRSDDWPFICYHEAYERRKMIEGLSYDAAHKKANVHEMQLRREFASGKHDAPAYKPATKVSGYVETPTPKQCGTCEYLTQGSLCKQADVRADAQVATDRKSGLKVVSPHDGCCNFWEADRGE